jgi:hypothetical protein
MRPLLTILGIGTLVAGGIAVAHAASSTASATSPDALDKRLLDAIATGLEGRLTAVAVEMQAAKSALRTEAATKIRDFYLLMGSGSVPADIGGQAIAAVRTLVPHTMLELASKVQSQYPQVATGLTQSAAYVDALTRHAWGSS